MSKLTTTYDQCRHISPQDPDRWRLYGRKPAGTENGGNRQGDKRLHFFQREQRRACYDYDHDQRRHADLL